MSKTAAAQSPRPSASQTWYRAYRPVQISDLHLVTVRTQLEAMLAAGRIPQALLFAGPRGTGKTSASRIIGALLNDEKNVTAIEQAYFSPKSASKKETKQQVLLEPDPSTELTARVLAGQSFVVAELDAASNRGIDDVRSLKERAFMPPAEGRMAVFILDEVHMFTTEAFNALLKLLEEPPPHAVFILATTELHKVPDTIVSRCTLVRFHQASLDELVAAFTAILSKEQLQFEAEALQAIAQLSEGSFRDGVKLLEQVASTGEVTLATVETVLGGSLRSQCQLLLEAVLAKDDRRVGSVIAQLRSSQVEAKFFVQTLFNYLHQQLLQHLGLAEGNPLMSRDIIEFLLRELLAANLLQATPIVYLPLELKLLELINRAKQRAGNSTGGGGVVAPVKQKVAMAQKKATVAAEEAKEEEQEDVSSLVIVSTPQHAEPMVVEAPVVAKATETALDVVTDSSGTLGHDLATRWDEFVQLVTQKNSTLGALLRSGRPMQDSTSSAKIGVFYRFHQEQLQSARFLSVIHQCSKEMLGSAPAFQFVLQETPSQADVVDHAAAEPLATAVADALLS